MTGTRYRVSWSPVWTERGLCAFDDDPDKWHPLDGDAKTAAEAKKVCRACPVRQVCRDYGIATEQPDGIWGGLDERQRRKIIRAAQPSRPADVEPSQPEAA